MKECEKMKFSASEAARIIGARSTNIISVWANRGLLTPSKVIKLSSKKRLFEFSYTNVFQAAILKELGDYFLIQYEFLNKLKGVDEGLGSKKLEQAIKMGKGFLVITDRAKNWSTDDLGREAKEKKQSIKAEIIEKQEEVVKCLSSSGYVLILNIAEIAIRLEHGIIEVGNGW
jgi:hypothetical protein